MDDRSSPSPYHPLIPAARRIAEVFDRPGTPPEVRKFAAEFRRRVSPLDRLQALASFCRLTLGAPWLSKQQAVTIDAALLAVERTRMMAGL